MSSEVRKDVVQLLDGNASTDESMCTYIYMDILFSYPTIFLSKRIQQLPKFVVEKAEQEAAAGQWGSLTYGALHEPRTLLGFPLMVTGKHKRLLQVGGECRQLKTILCFLAVALH